MSRSPKDMLLLETPDSEEFARAVHYGLLPWLEEKYRAAFPLGRIDFKYFRDGEVLPHIGQTVRKRNVYVVHSFCGRNGEYESNVGFMKLYLIDDALRRSSASEITYVLPYIPYQRQDRVDEPRVPISARRTLRMIRDPDIEVPTRIVTFDLHSPQIQGFANMVIDNLFAAPKFIEYLKSLDLDPMEFTVVAPDVGGVKRASGLAKRFNGLEIAILDKRRPERGKAEVIYVVGREHIDGRYVIIVDDIIDSGSTVIEGAEALRREGAKDIYVCCTHGIFSPTEDGPAEARLSKSGLKVIITDTIPRSNEYRKLHEDWLAVLSVAPTVSEAVYRIQRGEPLSPMFEEEWKPV